MIFDEPTEVRSEGYQLAQNLRGDKADASKHISARINIKLVEAKCGLARECGAQGGSTVQTLALIPHGPNRSTLRRLTSFEKEAHRTGLREENGSQYRRCTNLCLPPLGNKRLSPLGAGQ